jgi:hypothetical protein
MNPKNRSPLPTINTTDTETRLDSPSKPELSPHAPTLAAVTTNQLHRTSEEGQVSKQQQRVNAHLIVRFGTHGKPRLPQQTLT